jgi:hypothetical protein
MSYHRYIVVLLESRYHACKRTNPSLSRSFPCTQTNHAAKSYFRSSENQLEDIVEDKVAALSIREKLESLAVVHWSLLFVDLD